MIKQSLLFSETEQRHIPPVMWGKTQEVESYTPPTFFPRLHDAKRIFFDLETHDPQINDLGPGMRRDGYIVGISVKTDDWPGEYYPMRHVDGGNCDADKVLQWFGDELKEFKGELIGANSNLYDADYLQMTGLRPEKLKWRDVQWSEALLNETADSYALNVLAQKYAGSTKYKTELDTVYGLAKDYGINYMQYFREVHPAYARKYALTDVELLPSIYDAQVKQLKKEKLYDLYDLECRLTPFLLYMRRTGVRVDLDKAEKLEKELKQKYDAKNLELSKMVGFSIDPYSNHSLAKAFDVLKIPYNLTDKGNPSFPGQWLKQQNHPFAQGINETREYEKIRGTFVEGYILNGNINGRIYTQFHPLRRADEEESQRGTVSGRFSSTSPNLQNIPVRTDLGKRVRELFIPEEGWDWWARDYSQIEYRMLVHYAVAAGCRGAEVAQNMYITDPKTDFHLMVSALTGLDRKPAKNLNFGLVYGMGVWKLAATLGLVASQFDVDLGAANAVGEPLPEALKIMDTYHSKAPFIKEIYNMASEQAEAKGFVKTILNRRSRFELWEPKYTEKGFHPMPLPYEQALDVYGKKLKRSGTHKALNRILQGSAADLMKLSMVTIWEAGIIYDDGPVQCHLTVHDELDGSSEPSQRGKESLLEIEHLMNTSLKINVPILTEGATGANWAEAK